MTVSQIFGPIIIRNQPVLFCWRFGHVDHYFGRTEPKQKWSIFSRTEACAQPSAHPYISRDILRVARVMCDPKIEWTIGIPCYESRNLFIKSTKVKTRPMCCTLYCKLYMQIVKSAHACKWYYKHSSKTLWDFPVEILQREVFCKIVLLQNIIKYTVIHCYHAGGYHILCLFIEN